MNTTGAGIISRMRRRLLAGLAVLVVVCALLGIFASRVLTDRYDVGSNENLLSLSGKDFLPPALELDFSFESKAGFGTVDVKALKLVGNCDGSPENDALSCSVDIWIQAQGRKWFWVDGPLHDQRRVEQRLIPEIQREIGQRLRGDANPRFRHAAIVDAATAR